jgi:hypothetical protein
MTRPPGSQIPSQVCGYDLLAGLKRHDQFRNLGIVAVELRARTSWRNVSGMGQWGPRLRGQPSSETGIVCRGAVMCCGWPIPE